MATVLPFKGTRFNPEHVKLGGVLAPPYDVITAAQRDELYGRDLRNIVRIDYGITFPGDVEGVDDQYTRAASFLMSWLDLGVLVRDSPAGFYVVDHFFQHPDGGERRRRGVLATVGVRPWQSSDLRPHERTLRGPKADRLALMRATRAQTSPIFAVWTGAGGIADILDAVATGDALLGGRIDGEIASEKLLLWRVADPDHVASIATAMRSAELYVADGHHRYETAVAYAEERRTADPGAPGDSAFERCLVYLTAADDPGITILPTHRLVRPGPGIAFSLDDLWARLDDSFETEPAADGRAALATAASIHATHHAFAVVAHDGAAVLRRPQTVRRLAARQPRRRGSRNRGARAGRSVTGHDQRRRARVHARPRRARRRGPSRRGDPGVRRRTGERRGGHRGGGRRGDDAAEIHVLLSESPHRARAFRGLITQLRPPCVWLEVASGYSWSVQPRTGNH